MFFWNFKDLKQNTYNTQKKEKQLQNNKNIFMDLYSLT